MLPPMDAEDAAAVQLESVRMLEPAAAGSINLSGRSWLWFARSGADALQANSTRSYAELRTAGFDDGAEEGEHELVDAESLCDLPQLATYM